ncbi:MAG: hypothetical protein WAX12_03285 [Candidatus Microthrix subdominans]|jgi:hypothetical protein|uniref:hypothetical protein n=1 Tax=Candidatus Neomicrothrix sp. TaxID=2719034 RepID=UPI001B6F07B6|nr:hypothetical protein [Candidatus Microthrix sp.]MBK6312187.1 hypothetical protein [Candidatus Microthrix sp.]MBK6437175.1 hypothetical protein [Candidatus Microthrix sp.]MBK6969203.1 hypothetical protein [Candidatus Microthrix sp.]MBK7167121.1 hypothetical protein [Candidatus Microthrix sp.]MBK9559627.1 hypothetical protein [Candidatus Microthrix sp.]
MADTELGGDPVQMNDLAGYLAKKAAEIDGNVNDLRAKSRSVMWVGKDADTYRTAQIDGQLRKSSEAATATLRSGEKMLTEQARGQEQASAS